MENVLFLINHAGKAGTERYVRTLIENAADYGMRPYFAYNEPGPLSEQIQGMGVACRQIAMRGPYDLAAAKKLARICDDFGVGVIHTNYLRENYIAILTKTIYKRSLKVIYTNHFVTDSGVFVRFANKVMTPADHRVISVCEAGAPRLIKNGVCRKRIIVIHNAVDPQLWRPCADYGDIRAGTRQAYGIGDDEIVFLCASRFAHDKGHKFLIESLAELKEMHGVRQLRVLLAGDGPLEADARARVEASGLSGTVHFIGYVSDIRSMFYAADVYVNPSEHEALSFLILEALASGLPVIATDMGGNSEIINDRHGCGVLIAYGDTAAMSGALQLYRTNDALRDEKRRNALSVIEKKFALGDMLAKTFASFH